MFFPHAFKKSFLPVTPSSTLTLVSSGTTADLSAGELGLFNAKTYAAITAAGANVPMILAQGSYFTTDKIGPFHGGYTESVKSKVINPKYVSRFIKVNAKTAQNQIRTVSISNVVCDSTYRLRLDIKGSPALRLLSHNIYRTLDAYTGCCSGESGALVDPTTVAILWAKEINNHPVLSQFVTVAVKDTADAAVTDLDAFTPETTLTSSSEAKLVITAAYVDTRFGSCTFTPTDKYELEPIFIYTSFVDDSGEPCNVNGITSEETQAPRQASGSGETVLRDMILDGRYRQEAYPDSSRVESLRMREIEANPGLATVSRTGLYDQIMVLHNVPRLNNSSSTFDNDQYLLVINVPTGTTVTSFTTLFSSILTAAENGVTLETY